MALRRWHRDQSNLVLYNFSDADVSLAAAFPGGKWQKIFDSAAQQWDGPGSPLADVMTGGQSCSISLAASSFALFQIEPETAGDTP
jgi:hypothetical protein